MRTTLAVWFVIATLAATATAGTEASFRAEVQAKQAVVSSRFAGHIKRVAAHDGQVVARGDVIVEFDDNVPRTNVAVAERELAARQAELELAKTALKKATTHRELEQANVDLASARVANAGSKLDLARLELQRTTITAEIAGMVMLHGIKSGASVGRDEPIATLVDTDDAWIDALFSERQISSIKRGQRADVAIGPRAFHGTVDEINTEDAAMVHAVVDTGAMGSGHVGVHVKIKLDPRHRNLRPGMFADVTIHTR